MTAREETHYQENGPSAGPGAKGSISATGAMEVFLGSPWAGSPDRYGPQPEGSPPKAIPSKAPPLISVVVPVYKEEANIQFFLDRLIPVVEKIGTYEVIFCVDPSPDHTEQVIEKAIRLNPNVKMMVFSRRFGQPAATMAGILKCHGNTCAVIDVDLQDPPEVIADLYAKLQEGYEVVYATRRSRKGETWLKLLVSNIGYKVISRLASVHIPRNTGDFRIISRRVITELRCLKETHGFLRGLIGFVGFKHASVEYQRSQRYQGKGHYNRYLGSLKIGLNGLVGFSTTLLTISSVVGLMIALLNFLAIVFVTGTKLLLNLPYPIGTPMTICSILFMGGVQLMSIGLLGEYIGRIYEEVRERPMYIVDRCVNM